MWKMLTSIAYAWDRLPEKERMESFMMKREEEISQWVHSREVVSYWTNY